jgi:hypothetical protein
VAEADVAPQVAGLALDRGLDHGVNADDGSHEARAGLRELLRSYAVNGVSKWGQSTRINTLCESKSIDPTDGQS